MRGERGVRDAGGDHAAPRDLRVAVLGRRRHERERVGQRAALERGESRRAAHHARRRRQRAARDAKVARPRLGVGVRAARRASGGLGRRAQHVYRAPLRLVPLLRRRVLERGGEEPFQFRVRVGRQRTPVVAGDAAAFVALLRQAPRPRLVLGQPAAEVVRDARRPRVLAARQGRRRGEERRERGLARRRRRDGRLRGVRPRRVAVAAAGFVFVFVFVGRPPAPPRTPPEFRTPPSPAPRARRRRAAS